MAEVVESAAVKATADEFKSATERAFGKPGVQAQNNAAPKPEPVKPNESTPQPPAAQAPENKPDEQKPAQGPVDLDAISDEEFEKQLAKRTKGAFKSLGDLKVEPKKTKEELAAEAEDERTAALNHALVSGKVKREDYERAISGKDKENRAVALDLFARDVREIDPKLKDEEVEEMFKDHYREELSDDDPKRKVRIKEMNALADRFKKENYGFLDTIEPEYREHRTAEANRTAIGKKLDTLFEAVVPNQTYTTTYSDTDGTEQTMELSYPIDDAELKSIKREVKKNLSELYGKYGVKVEDVKDVDVTAEINSVIKARTVDKMVPVLMKNAAEKAVKDLRAHLKAIPVRQPNNHETAAPNGAANQGRVVKKEFTQAEKDRFPSSFIKR